MKLFKNSVEAEKTWQAVVYKMKEAEENSKQLTSLEERVNFIFKEQAHKSSVSKKAVKSTK